MTPAAPHSWGWGGGLERYTRLPRREVGWGGAAPPPPPSPSWRWGGGMQSDPPLPLLLALGWWDAE